MHTRPYRVKTPPTFARFPWRSIVARGADGARPGPSMCRGRAARCCARCLPIDRVRASWQAPSHAGARVPSFRGARV